MRIDERCVEIGNCSGEPGALLPCGQNTDPRLTAEETCPLSLIQAMGHSTLEDGWLLLDLSLGSARSDSYRAEIHAKFEQAVRDRPQTQSGYSARVALDCLPLYEARRANEQASDTTYQTVYKKLAKTAQRLLATPSTILDPAHRLGMASEYATLALLIRAKKEAYPASYRSDKSNIARYNHDLESFEDNNKIPVQIKSDSIASPDDMSTNKAPKVATTRHGVRNISVAGFIESTVDEYRRQNEGASLPPATILGITRLIAEEANMSHDPTSTEAALLDYMGSRLHDIITGSNDVEKSSTWEASDELNRLVRRKSNSSGNATAKTRQPLTLRLVTNRHNLHVVSFDRIELRTMRAPAISIERALATAALHGEYLGAEDFDLPQNKITTSITLRHGKEETFTASFTVDVANRLMIDSPIDPTIVGRLLERLHKTRQHIDWQKPTPQK